MLSQLNFTLHIYILQLCAGWEGTKCLDEYQLLCVHIPLTVYVLHVQVADRGKYTHSQRIPIITLILLLWFCDDYRTYYVSMWVCLPAYINRKVNVHGLQTHVEVYKHL